MKAMLRLDWRCVHCLKDLPSNVRADAFFCQAPTPEPPKLRSREKKKDPDSLCRRTWYGRRVRVRSASARMAQLEASICQCADVAVWYRLALLRRDTLWLYPAIDRPTMRFDGVMRQTPGFRIHPYEPPVVPKSDEYSASYYDWEGSPVDTPRDHRTAEDVPAGGALADYSLFKAEPVVIVSLESGQRWDLLDNERLRKPPGEGAIGTAATYKAYKFPFPPLQTQVMDQRPAKARSYRLISTTGRSILPGADDPSLPLHPFINPTGLLDGEYYIEYYEKETIPLPDKPDEPAIATICRGTPLAPPVQR